IPTWILLTAALLALTPAFGEAKRAEPAMAQVRVWKGDFPSKRVLKISVRGSGRKSAVAEIASGAEGYFFSPYRPVLAGSSIIEVTDVQDAKNKPTALSVTLAPGSFSTVLLAENGGLTSIELLSDTISSPPSSELRVCNFAPLASLQIDVGEDLHARLNPQGALLHVRGIPQKKIQVRTSGVDSSGKSVRGSNEVDFTQSPRVTILIYPDTYGRIRPRIVIDGQFLDLPADEANAGKVER
ncbi:MAG: hypothetical protein WCF18_09990, partial [Chthoniobacteraceae bacterium]